MGRQPRVSVVCNTLDRADALDSMLRSLRQLTYAEVEVVVVAGPCRDHTDLVLDRWADAVKVRRCPRPNLSASRNIGIRAAAGEVVAFIDDDAVAEPSWLDELISLYDSDEVGAAGGVAFDHTGYTYQCRYNSVDRLGNARWDHAHPVDNWSSPGGWEVPYVIGTNSSFRRRALVDIGGFDEEFEYYLDESDVCMRLVDDGHLIRQSEHAPVHHKFLTSKIRDPQRITLNLFPVIKNKIYFSLVNGREHASLTDIFEDNARFAINQRHNLRVHYEAGAVDAEQLAEAEASIERGWEAGLAAGFRGRMPPTGAELLLPDSEFMPFPTIGPRPGRRRICLLSRSSPGETGGISRYMADAARALVDRGHEVRVISETTEHATVDLEDGVWVHRIPATTQREPVIATSTPERVWSHASAVADELLRMQRHRPVDVVYGALWDTEAVAVLERCTMPVVTSLVTSLAITLELRPEWRTDKTFLDDYVVPLIDTERTLVQRSHLVHALSEAVLTEVERTSAVDVDPARVHVGALGTADRDHLEPTAVGGASEILFVGRFEKRKGIDLLLGAVPDLLQQRPHARVTLIGRDDLPGESNEPYRAAFERLHAEAPWRDRVQFLGVVDDDTLWKAYDSCDIFVAPSRFESFGLIFVEAMRAGKPVIALNRGAAPEVVEDGVSGLLIDEGTELLRAAIIGLVDDPQRRQAMGAAGRRRYEERFTLEAMGERLEHMFERIEQVPVNDPRWQLPVPTSGGVDGVPTLDLGHGSARLQVVPGAATTILFSMPAAAESPAIVSHGGWEQRVLPSSTDVVWQVNLPTDLDAGVAVVSGPPRARLVGAILVHESTGVTG